MPLRLAMSRGSPTISSAPYSDPPAGTLRSVSVTSLAVLGARLKDFSVTANASSVRRRLGLATPDEDCVHGRGVTVTVSVSRLLLATVMVLAAPTAAARSIFTGLTESPRTACAARADGWDSSARAM